MRPPSKRLRRRRKAMAPSLRMVLMRQRRQRFSVKLSSLEMWRSSTGRTWTAVVVNRISQSKEMSRISKRSWSIQSGQIMALTLNSNKWPQTHIKMTRPSHKTTPRIQPLLITQLLRKASVLSRQLRKRRNWTRRVLPVTEVRSRESPSMTSRSWSFHHLWWKREFSSYGLRRSWYLKSYGILKLKVSPMLRTWSMWWLTKKCRKVSLKLNLC